MTKIYEDDSFDILVTVTDEDTGNPLDLTGATVEAIAGRDPTQTTTGAVEIPDPRTDGNIAVSFDAGAFQGMTGQNSCHVRVIKDGETQTVAVVKFSVQSSL